ncbi:lytic transglycosylase domain-containing protein [Clostridium sp. D53t1_180928_C8]|uniref:lytic transglycosylase domain-containing protein n=1 Tax=Clostridium sp. D53t1_180928_C8 TaxID=2787101 RepID=UPI0018AA9C9C|nr:lytic transglycosylase domain-containing protein [Clostridium sp. D53t1_180928_C8]
MLNNIQDLSNIYSILKLNDTNNIKSTNISRLSDMNSISSLLYDSSNSTSSAFNIMLTSLLKSISEKNKVECRDLEKVSLEGMLSKYINGVKSSGIINSNNYMISNINSLNVDERIKNSIQLYSNKYSVDPNLVKAIIKVESDFNPNLVSSAGAKGLMQLMPEICEELGIKDQFNIEQNIEGGVRHIKGYIDKYNGNIEMALIAYNGGPTRMINRGVKSIEDIYKMPKETQSYVPKVMNYYRGLINGN